MAWRFQPGVAVSVSRDGGATWEPAQGTAVAGRAMSREARAAPGVNGTPPRVLAASAPSDAVCWAVGTGGLVMITTDAATWKRQTFPDASDLVAVNASDSLTAVVTARDGRRYETRDGGASWQRLP